MDGARAATGMITGGLIAAVVGVTITLLLSLLIPFPWDGQRTLVCVAIASFMGSAVSFLRGYQVGRSRD